MRDENTLPDGRRLSDVELAYLTDVAKRWVRDMLEMGSVPAGDDAQYEIEEAVKKIVAIYVKYDVLSSGRFRILGTRAYDEALAVLDDLRHRLESIIWHYGTECTQDDDEKTRLIKEVRAEFHGLTEDARVKSRVMRMWACLNVYADGLAKKKEALTDEALAASIATISGIKSLKRLVETEVVRTWQAEYRHINEDANYVHVYRGSSYPCDICDDEVAKGWQKTEDADYPPFHANCKCYCVFV